MMRHLVLPAVALVCAAAPVRGDDPSPSYFSSDVTVLRTGDKVAGRIGACLAGVNKKPKMCFGLAKEFDGDAEFTFVVLFKTGKKDAEPTGSGGEVSSDGTTATLKYKYELGDFELPVTLESKRDAKARKVTTTKVVVGTIDVTAKGPGVVVVDLTGEKPAYTFVKVALPKCKIDLADTDHKTWPKAIDEAVAELKKASKEVAALAD
jgi:hypothetical protein